MSALEAGVHQTLRAMEDAWNGHDVPEYVDRLAEDCEWVNVVGMHWKGRATIQRALDHYHRTMFRDVGLHTESVAVRPIAPGVAVAVASVRADAFAAPDGRSMPAALNRLTYVLVEREDDGSSRRRITRSSIRSRRRTIRPNPSRRTKPSLL